MKSLGSASRQRRQQRSFRIRRYKFFPTFLAIVGIVAWASIWIAWMETSTQQRPPPRQANKDNDQVRRQKSATRRLPIRDMDLNPHNLQHHDFLVTLKSCLPSESGEKCKQFIPDSGIERIGILSPPGAIGAVFESFIDDVFKAHLPYNNRSLEVIKMAHVPPYGYGKTHGFTKFIRLATMPLSLAASDLVLDQVTHGILHTTEDIILEDVTQALRQVVRWHCRLSHLAAHTAIMTITLEELIKDPREEEYQVRGFLNLLHQDDGNDNKTTSLEEHMKLKNHIHGDKFAHSMFDVVHRSTNLLMRLDEMLQYDKADHNVGPTTIGMLMDSIITEELESTHHLQDWPCKSFWDFDHEITDTSKHTAKLFAPNCTAFSSTNCWVPRDLCEVQGDAKCLKQKRS